MKVKQKVTFDMTQADGKVKRFNKSFEIEDSKLEEYEKFLTLDAMNLILDALKEKDIY